MSNQELNIDTLSRYMDIMDRLWSLNQSMMKRNMEYTLWENEQLKKALRPMPESGIEGDDLPF